MKGNILNLSARIEITPIFRKHFNTTTEHEWWNDFLSTPTYEIYSFFYKSCPIKSCNIGIKRNENSKQIVISFFINSIFGLSLHIATYCLLPSPSLVLPLSNKVSQLYTSVVVTQICQSQVKNGVNVSFGGHMFYYSHVWQNVCAVVPIRIGTEAY